jgi:hypothetical protein
MNYTIRDYLIGQVDPYYDGSEVVAQHDQEYWKKTSGINSNTGWTFVSNLYPFTIAPSPTPSITPTPTPTPSVTPTETPTPTPSITPTETPTPTPTPTAVPAIMSLSYSSSLDPVDIISVNNGDTTTQIVSGSGITYYFTLANSGLSGSQLNVASWFYFGDGTTPGNESAYVSPPTTTSLFSGQSASFFLQAWYTASAPVFNLALYIPSNTMSPDYQLNFSMSFYVSPVPPPSMENYDDFSTYGAGAMSPFSGGMNWRESGMAVYTKAPD